MRRSSRLIPFSVHRIGVGRRVSTDPQNDASQDRSLRDEFARRGWEWPPSEFIFSEKQSAYKRKNFQRRPALRRATELLVDGTLRGMMWVEPSRVSRFARDAELWYEQLEKIEPQPHVIFSDEPHPALFTHEGRRYFVGAIANAEKFSLDLGRRVARGRKSAAAQGRYGGSVRPRGTRVRDGVVRFTKPDALMIQRAIRLVHDEDKSCAEAAAVCATEFGVPVSRRDVQRWCTMPVYFGLVRHAPMRYGRNYQSADDLRAAKLVRARWRGLVPRRWFRELRAKFDARAHAGKGSHKRSRTRYPLGRGFIVCSACNESAIGEMQDTSRNSIVRWIPGYTCQRKPGKRCASGRAAIAHDELLRQFGAIITRIRPSAEMIAMYAEMHAEYIRSHSKPQGDTPARIARKRDALGLGLARREIGIDEYTRRAAELDEAEAHIARAGARAPTAPDLSQSIALLSTMADAWQRLDALGRAELTRAVFRRCTVDIRAKRLLSVTVDESIAPMLAGTPALAATDGPLVWRVVDGDSADDEIVRTLRGLGVATTREIADALGLDSARIANRIARLSRAGRIAQDGYRVEYRPHPKQVRLWRAA